jgi:hypothetical protein
VILGSGPPIVLCAIDWLGVANDAHTEFCERLATATGTTADRVAVHALHQHDAPRCDFTSEQILADAGVAGKHYDLRFCRSVMVRAAEAAEQAIETAQPVTHIGIGQAPVHEVASNRRILGEDGKVRITRYTACRDPKVRAMPVGTIDPQLKIITLHNQDKPVVALTYYATHPQSYYRTGQANPDFPGMARNQREAETSVPHIHFNGAGGNIGAGKWNDGAKENRQRLADKVTAGMRLAWDSRKISPVGAADVGWNSVQVALPVGRHIQRESLQQILADPDTNTTSRLTAAKHLAWLQRSESGQHIRIGCLSLGNTHVLHMPGELFVEYQLEAQKMLPAGFVAMAAYGDYGPGYIGTQIAYSQGGYETSEGASRVAPEVEPVLTDAMRTLLPAE